MWLVDVISGFKTETLGKRQLGYFLSNKLFIFLKQYHTNHKILKQQISVSALSGYIWRRQALDKTLSESRL